jgi:hypothetical protein
MGHGNHLEKLAVGGKVILGMILSMSKSDDKTWTVFDSGHIQVSGYIKHLLLVSSYAGNSM